MLCAHVRVCLFGFADTVDAVERSPNFRWHGFDILYEICHAHVATASGPVQVVHS